MPDALVTVKGHLLGLTANNDLVVRDPATNTNRYVPSSTTVRSIVQITQVAYDALDPPDATTLYVIID